MADEKFKKWSDRYKKGEIKTATMPPLPAGPTGLGRQVIGSAVGTGLRALRDAYTKSQKTQARNAQRREIAADKRASREADKAARAKEKFGPLVKRQDNLPATQGGSRALVKREDRLPATRGSDSRALTVAREGKGDLVRTGGGRSLATTGGRTFGDKGQGGRIVGLSNKGKLAVGAGAAGAAAAGYKAATSGSAAEKKRSKFAETGPMSTVRDFRKGVPMQIKAVKANADDAAKSKQNPTVADTSPANKKSNSVGGTKNGPFKSDFAKKSLQGRKPGASSPMSGKPSGKSSVSKAPGKMTNFERQKARQYEKEGYGGRSLTSSGAKARVTKERGYKFKDLFKKK